MLYTFTKQTIDVASWVQKERVDVSAFDIDPLRQTIWFIESGRSIVSAQLEAEQPSYLNLDRDIDCNLIASDSLGNIIVGATNLSVIYKLNHGYDKCIVPFYDVGRNSGYRLIGPLMGRQDGGFIIQVSYPSSSELICLGTDGTELWRWRLPESSFRKDYPFVYVAEMLNRIMVFVAFNTFHVHTLDVNGILQGTELIEELNMNQQLMHSPDGTPAFLSPLYLFGAFCSVTSRTVFAHYYHQELKSQVVLGRSSLGDQHLYKLDKPVRNMKIINGNFIGLKPEKLTGLAKFVLFDFEDEC